MNSMYIASLSSSSTCGNAYVVWDDETRPVLIDCGISLRRLCKGLGDLGMVPEDIGGLFITHEHRDHVSAMCLVTPVAQRYDIPVYASRGFWNWYSSLGRFVDPSLINVVGDGSAVEVGNALVEAFEKPHDAREPLGFVVRAGGCRAAFVMDLGHVPRTLEEQLLGCEYLVFEANHDVDMEKNSGRPSYLIQRVLGNQGHLSNEQAAECLSRLVGENTKQVILAHLSTQCNTPKKAVGAVCAKLLSSGINCDVSAAPAGDVAVYGGR